MPLRESRLSVLTRAGRVADRLVGAVAIFSLAALLGVIAVRPAPSPPPVRDLTVGIHHTGGGWSFNRAERCYMKKINNIRENHGLPPASSDPQLGYVARLHSKHMAANHSVYHDDRFGERVTNWMRLGQNTGRGVSCRSVTRAFMNDPVHRDIILGDWDFIGVGVVNSGNYSYVQQLFESSRNPGNIYNTP